MKRSRFREIVREVLVDVMSEDTTLRSLVAKAESEQIANAAVQTLSSKGMQARVVYPAEFGLQADEVPGWGVYVEPGAIQDAAKILATSSAKGLQFDPVVRTGK